jgi:E3 ubiquitin-protein ligase Mdm2
MADDKQMDLQNSVAEDKQMDLQNSVADPMPRNQTLIEINRSILHALYTFKENAPLKNYILNKRPSTGESLTLAEVLTILKEIIRDEGMFDMKNPAVILCDQNLEKALNMRALHVTEIRDIVYSQLTRLPDDKQDINRSQNSRQQHNYSVRRDEQQLQEALTPTDKTTVSTSQTSVAQQSVNGNPAPQTSNGNLPAVAPQTSVTRSNNAPETPIDYTNNNARYTLKSEFRSVLATLPTFNQNQTLFAYSEVSELLSNYIRSKKNFIDPRNPKLAIIKDDPLSKAFKVDSFHQCQLTSLMRKQLIYVSDAVPGPSNVPGIAIQLPGNAIPIPRTSLYLVPRTSADSVLRDRRMAHTGAIAYRIPGTALAIVVVPETSTTSSVPGNSSQPNSRMTATITTTIPRTSATPGNSSQPNSGMIGPSTSPGTSTSSIPGNSSQPNSGMIGTSTSPGTSSSSIPGNSRLMQTTINSQRNMTDLNTRIRNCTDKIAEYATSFIGKGLGSTYDERMKYLTEEIKKHISGILDNRSCPTIDEPPANQSILMTALMAGNTEKEGSGRTSEAKNEESPEDEYSDEEFEEYDVDSTEEQEVRPPQAGGGTGMSTDENSDPECLQTPVQIEDSDGESAHWADNEDTMMIELKSGKHEPTTFFKSFPHISSQKCLGCKLGKTPDSRYCKTCWQKRKDWLPNPPKKAKRFSRRKRNEQRDKRLGAKASNCFIETENTIATSDSSLCIFCYAEPRNATIIHGKLGHQLSCYPCAKKLWKEHARCPVCRRKIEKIVKLIQT